MIIIDISVSSSLLLITVHRAASNNGTKMFCHHANLFTKIYVQIMHFVQASGGASFHLFSVTFYLWMISVPLVLQSDNGITINITTVKGKHGEEQDKLFMLRTRNLSKQSICP